MSRIRYPQRVDGPAGTPVRPQLQFSGFGRFQAEVDGAPVPLSPITGTMLARLVLARGRLVDAEDLYLDTWPDPVRTVRREHRVAVHKRISELRRFLAPRLAGGDRTILLTERSARTGYRLVLDTDQVDLYTFEDLIYRASAGQDAVAIELLSRALSLWTDRPLLGLPDRAFVRDSTARLVALRERACRELAEVCLLLKRRRDALAIFDHLQAGQPTDAGLCRLIEQLGHVRDDRMVRSARTRPGAVRPAVWQVRRRMPGVVSPVPLRRSDLAASRWPDVAPVEISGARATRPHGHHVVPSR